MLVQSILVVRTSCPEVILSGLDHATDCSPATLLVLRCVQKLDVPGSASMLADSMDSLLDVTVEDLQGACMSYAHV